jgi:hypothetical protein
MATGELHQCWYDEIAAQTVFLLYGGTSAAVENWQMKIITQSIFLSNTNWLDVSMGCIRTSKAH